VLQQVPMSGNDLSEFYLTRLQIYDYAEDWEAVVAEANQFAEATPDSQYPYFMRAWALAKLNRDLDQAMEDINHALELTSEPWDQAQFYETRALIHAQLGDYEAALADYDRAFGFDTYLYYGANSILYYNRALLHDQIGNEAEALADYQEFLRRNPGLIDIYHAKIAHARERIEALGGEVP
jgi:tetratricopeptide (TPR) repeat protein